MSSVCCADQYGNCNRPFPACTENGKTQQYLLQNMRRLLPNSKERSPRSIGDQQMSASRIMCHCFNFFTYHENIQLNSKYSAIKTSCKIWCEAILGDKRFKVLDEILKRTRRAPNPATGGNIFQCSFFWRGTFEAKLIEVIAMSWWWCMPPSASAGNRVNLFHLHFSPLSRPVPAFEHPTQEEENVSKMFYGLHKLNESIRNWKIFFIPLLI